MSTKNKAASNSPWKIGGELSSAAPLNTAEMAQLEKAFEIAESARDSFYRGFKQISRADAKRNQSAAQAVSAFLCDRFAEQYSHEDVVEAVAVSSSVLVPLTTQLENQQDYLVGGTLWLLDYLKAHCKSTQDYVSLLPEADESLDCAMPFVADLDHPISVITQIMTVLQGRKKKYHKVLGSLLALIDDATAAKLRQFFMTSFLEYMDRSMKVHSRLKALGQDSPRCEADTLPKQGAYPGLLPELPRTEKYLALVMGPQFICRPVAEIEKRLQSKKASELLSGYSTTDPYALCAAYLLLEYEQDALAYLGSLTAAVVSCGTNHLPWTRVTLFTESFIAEELFDSALPDHTLQYEYQERHPLHDETPFKTKLASEEQIFFNATNVMMPRHRRPSQQLIQFFVTQGIPEQRARELALAAMFVYYTDAGPHDLELSEYDDADVEDAAECALEANQQETPLTASFLISRKLRSRHLPRR